MGSTRDFEEVCFPNVQCRLAAVVIVEREIQQLTAPHPRGEQQNDREAGHFRAEWR